MSYGIAAALQGAVYQRLAGDASVAALSGGEIHDAAPSGMLPPLYVSLGPEAVRDRSDKTGAGARHDFTVSVVATGGGFQAAKDLAAAISDALAGEPPVLERGRIVGLWFLRAKAARSPKDDLRRIDMTFRARVEDI